MPFREKSAWVMSLALLSAGIFYFIAVAVIWNESGQLAHPMLPLVIVYTICLTIIAALGHAIIAALAPKEANAPADERELKIIYSAGHYSSHIFAVGTLLSLGWYLFSGDGDLLFYTVFASFMAGQIMEYAIQIFLYRTSI
tara:strand:+ start:4015 stop:4437 length:423 start_codon:yes stop_codon:yes gene_type:complete